MKRRHETRQAQATVTVIIGIVTITGAHGNP